MANSGPALTRGGRNVRTLNLTGPDDETLYTEITRQCLDGLVAQATAYLLAGIRSAFAAADKAPEVTAFDWGSPGVFSEIAERLRAEAPIPFEETGFEIGKRIARRFRASSFTRSTAAFRFPSLRTGSDHMPDRLCLSRSADERASCAWRT